MGALAGALAAGLASSAAAAGTPARAGVPYSIDVQPQVRSVTVDTSRVVLCASRALRFPDGRCQSSTLSVTNGGAPAKIEVKASEAAPSDGNQAAAWKPCAPDTSSRARRPRCDGPRGLPGLDQMSFSLAAFPSFSLLTALSADPSFGQRNGQALPGQRETEQLRLIGPEYSTDESSAFTGTITWTAEVP